MIFRALEQWTSVPWVLQAALLSSALLVLSGLLIRRRLVGVNAGVVPDPGVSLRNVFEVVVESLGGLAHDIMGPDWRRYFAIPGTIFFFVLISNLMGLIPGFDGATSDINATLGWAVIAWTFYWVIGIRKHGLGRYLVKYMGPSFFEKEIGGRTVHFRLLFWLFFPLEILVDFSRMGTLSVRLLANMFAGHTVIAVWMMLVPLFVPAIFMGMEIFVSLLQAFVFSLLTMIYIGLALDEPH
jgi:F-type H+-transporting ATPase subunit a